MKHQLNTDRYDSNYILIAIRSGLEDYQFAYFLNKSDFFRFKRMDKDLYYLINEKRVFFSTFENFNLDLKRKSFLINNKSIYNSELVEANLFNNKSIKQVFFLIPELKKFDYFLKLKGIWKSSELESLIFFLKNFKQIESQAIIKLSNLKSISNLVF